MPPRLDLVGRKFGRLQVKSFAGIHPKHKTSMWLCDCECSAEYTTAGTRMLSGMTSSCGCYHKDRTSEAHTKHGGAANYTQTPEHYIWQAMLRRCLTKTHPNYADYGGRGITVCDRWLTENNGFVNFLADMGPRPPSDPNGSSRSKYSLDRIDNDKGYSPENCRWTTHHQQMRNNRRNRWITFNGHRRTAKDWSVITGISHRTIYNRLKAGNDAIQALRPYSNMNPIPEPPGTDTPDNIVD